MSKHGPPSVGRVIDVKMMGPRLKRVQILCEKMVGFDYHPGQRLAIKTDIGAYRDYSISSLDPISGCAEVYAYLHGIGPGSQKMQSLNAGDALEFLGPLKGASLKSEFDSIFLVGDETAIAVALSFFNDLAVNKETKKIICALEVSHDLVADVSRLIPQTQVVKRDKRHPGKTIAAWLRDREIFPLGTYAILLGRDLSVQLLKDVLLNEFGFAPTEIQTCVHWYEGRALR